MLGGRQLEASNLLGSPSDLFGRRIFEQEDLNLKNGLPA